MSFKTADIVAGGFRVSGSWGTISGTYIQVMRMLNAEQIPADRVKGIVFDSGSLAFIAFIKMGIRED